MKKILIVSAGGLQGQALINLFNALNVFEVHICDISTESIGRYLCTNYFVVPPVADKNLFLNSIQFYVHKYDIDFVVPSTVYELYPLDELKLRSKATILVSSKKGLDLFLDKISTYYFFVEFNVPTLPMVHDFHKVKDGRLIAKYRSGFGGKGVHLIQNETEFIKYRQEDYLIQPYLESFEETSVDIFFGPYGISKPLLRKRISTTGGYSVISESTNSDVIEKTLSSLLLKMSDKGAFGFFNIQFLTDLKGKVYVSDVNPRIGTSSALAHWRLGEVLQCINPEFEFDFSNNKSCSQGDRIVRIVHDQLVPNLDLDHIDTIGFDLDDTLIDHKKWVQRQMKRFIHELNLAKDFESKVLLECAIILEEHRVNQTVDILLEKFGDKLPSKDTLLHIYRSSLPRHVDVYPDVEVNLKALRERGYRLILLTNNPVATQQAKIELSGLATYFDGLYFSRSISKSKPSKDSFNLMVEGSLCDLNSVAYVGDHLYRDIYGALNAGCGFCFLIERKGSFLNSSPVGENDLIAEIDYQRISGLSELLWYCKGRIVN